MYCLCVKVGSSFKTKETGMVNRLAEMEAFVAVVEGGGFTSAANRLQVSKSAVSKLVQSLELRLGARVLNRTTRRVHPTEIGIEYFNRAKKIISAANESDSLVRDMQMKPVGQLRVAAITDFGAAQISPTLPEFMQNYPDVGVELVLCNRPVELISEGFDLSIRMGFQKDSTLRARSLSSVVYHLVASPAYLDEHGRPEIVEDLRDHLLLRNSQGGSPEAWDIKLKSGENRVIRKTGHLSVNSGEALVQAAVAGQGIAYLPSFLISKLISDEKLERLDVGQRSESLPVYAVYPSGKFTSPKIRAFIDHLVKSFA